MAAYTKKQMAKAKDGLCLAMELTRSEVCVGAYLLKRTNKKTGQCNPSIDRIVQDLGYSRSTVIRAENGLVDKGYFTKELYGSRASTNQYNPCWSKLAEVTSAIEDKIFGKRKRISDSPERAAVKPKRPQECDPGSSSGETQTLKKELPKKTLSKQDVHSDEENGRSNGMTENDHTNSKPVYSRTSSHQLVPSKQSKRIADHREVALEKAKKRIDDEIRQNHPDFYLNNYINLPGKTLANAYEIEIDNNGSGVSYLLSTKTVDQ